MEGMKEDKDMNLLIFSRRWRDITFIHVPLQSHLTFS